MHSFAAKRINMNAAAVLSDRDQRRQAILECVRAQQVKNQSELARLLAADGIRVNQATLSRDLRDMGLLKGPNGYELPADATHGAHDPSMALFNAVLAMLTRVDRAQNLLVLHTIVGAASPLAIALDRAGWREVVGTIAGDDTVLAVCRSAEHARRAARQLAAMQEKKRK